MKKRTLIYSLFAILIIFNVGCDEESIDLLPPSEVSNLTANSENQIINLDWTDPENDDFDHIEITYSPGSANFIFINKGTEEYNIEGLTEGTEYSITVKTVDSNGNKSTGITVNKTLAYEIEGEYKCNVAEYYRIGVLSYTASDWPDKTTIVVVNENTYNVTEYFGPFSNNSWYFQIDENNNITYPLVWDGMVQTANEQSLITCESNPSDFINVNCNNSNFVTYDDNYGKHLLTMTMGYYMDDSGPREFYQVLEKII